MQPLKRDELCYLNMQSSPVELHPLGAASKFPPKNFNSTGKLNFEIQTQILRKHIREKIGENLENLKV